MKVCEKSNIVYSDQNRNASILPDLNLISVPNNINRFSAPSAQTGDSSTLPDGRQRRQYMQRSIRCALQQHFRDTSTGAEVSINLKRRMSIQ